MSGLIYHDPIFFKDLQITVIFTTLNLITHSKRSIVRRGKIHWSKFHSFLFLFFFFTLNQKKPWYTGYEQKRLKISYIMMMINSCVINILIVWNVCFLLVKRPHKKAQKIWWGGNIHSNQYSIFFTRWKFQISKQFLFLKRFQIIFKNVSSKYLCKV